MSYCSTVVLEWHRTREGSRADFMPPASGQTYFPLPRKLFAMLLLGIILQSTDNTDTQM